MGNIRLRCGEIACPGERVKKLLMLAYHFPPLTTSGMYRSLQFARYLPLHRWAPTIVTVRPETIAAPGALDDAPLRDLPEETRIERARVFEPLQAALSIRDRFSSRNGSERPTETNTSLAAETTATWRDWISDLLSLPDRQAGWIPAASSRALSLIRERGADGIYSSSPPASTHVAALVTARLSGLPWIADFRDPWISNRFAPVRRTRFFDSVDRWLEREVVARADRIVVNTEELRDDFRRRYAGRADIFVTITNGFDPEERLPPAPKEKGKPFTIIHTGTIYGLRDPTPILRAVENLIRRGIAREDDLSLRFLGSVAGEERWRDLLSRGPLSRVVRFEPKAPRPEALRSLARSDLLLLIQTGTELQVPRKLYEYVAVGKPILALVTEGATENLIRKENLGWIVHPDRPEEIEKVLEGAITGMEPPRPHNRDRFDFRRLTGDLVRELEEVVT